MFIWLYIRLDIGAGQPDLNRHSSFEPRDFRTTSAFAALPRARSHFRLVCGLDYTFTVARSRFRCCSSSLYISRRSFDRCAWLGIACYRIPEFGQFCSSSFLEGTQFA